MISVLDLRTRPDPWFWLLAAVGIGRGATLAVTGGAGKTSLCREAAIAWNREDPLSEPWLSTTTKIARGAYPPPFVWYEWSEVTPVPALASGIPVIVRPGRPPGGEAPAKGVSLSEQGIAALARRFRGPGLVEADGSRGLPGKFYRPHEPQIPARADAIVQVFGHRLITDPVSPATVHALASAPRRAPWTLSRSPDPDEVIEILKGCRRAHEARTGREELRGWHLALTGGSQLAPAQLSAVVRAAWRAGGFSSMILLPDLAVHPDRPGRS